MKFYIISDICQLSVLFEGEDFTFAPFSVTIYEVFMPKKGLKLEPS